MNYKKLFILIFTILISVTFIFSNEVDNEEVYTGDKYEQIKKEYGIGYIKGDSFLKTKKDFINALSPIPQAKDIYIKSRRFKAAGFVLLGTNITSYLAAAVLTGFGLAYSDPYYSTYDPILALSFSIAALSILGLMIPQIIVMIVSFVKALKLKKEAIAVYNLKVKKMKKKNDITFNIYPYFSIDKKNKDIGLRFNLSYAF